MCWHSLVVEGRLRSGCGAQPSHWLSCCRAQALDNEFSGWGLVLHSMWDPPGPRIEPISPALAGQFLTIGPPGKSMSLGLP